VLVTTGVLGAFYRRFYIKKGSVWTEDHMVGKLKERNCLLLLNPASYTMDGGIQVTVLTQLAQEMKVTKLHRYLLLLDGHGSRLEPAVLKAAEELGFVLHLYPLTHIMQVRTHPSYPSHIFWGALIAVRGLSLFLESTRQSQKGLCKARTRDLVLGVDRLP
jgi:hypothetical protein